MVAKANVLQEAMRRVDGVDEAAGAAVEEALAPAAEGPTEPVEAPPQVALTTTQQPAAAGRPPFSARVEALYNELDMKRHSSITHMEELQAEARAMQIEHEEEMAERHRVFVEKMERKEAQMDDARREREIIESTIELMRGAR